MTERELKAEIARLQNEVYRYELILKDLPSIEKAEAEMATLRAELEIARQSDTDYQAYIENASLREKVEQLRAATIEECAVAIDKAAIEADSDGWSACDYSGYIRSLANVPKAGQ